LRLEPLHRQVLIVPISRGDTSKGGLLIPDIAKNSSPFRYGDVVAVGTGTRDAAGHVVPCIVKVGDVVMYAKGAGIEVPIEDERGERMCVLMDEKYIAGIAHDLPRVTAITGLDGRLMSMQPMSRAMPDSAAKNREELELAEQAGFADGGTQDEDNGMTG
jgi:chaperonin GroES